MSAISIPAFRWDAANRAPQPDAVLVLRCTEGHSILVTHRAWHLIDDVRCEACGCLADVHHARKHSHCPCDVLGRMGQQQHDVVPAPGPLTTAA